MFPHFEGHGANWWAIYLRKPATNAREGVRGLVVFELTNLTSAEAVHPHFS